MVEADRETFVYADRDLDCPFKTIYFTVFSWNTILPVPECPRRVCPLCQSNPPIQMEGNKDTDDATSTTATSTKPIGTFFNVVFHTTDSLQGSQQEGTATSAATTAAEVNTNDTDKNNGPYTVEYLNLFHTTKRNSRNGGQIRYLLLLLTFQVMMSRCLAFIVSHDQRCRKSKQTKPIPQKLQARTRVDGDVPIVGMASTSMEDIVVDEEHKPDNTNVGLYRKFVTHAWEKLESTGWFDTEQSDGGDENVGSSSSSTRTRCHYRVAPARGSPNSVVQMTVRSMGPSSSSSASDNLLRYARYALLETVPKTTSASSEDVTATVGLEEKPTVHTQGIQVLNLVVFPSSKTTLPAWGVDLVSLPGGKHLMLMDVHPMRLFGDGEQNDTIDKHDASKVYPHHKRFKQWHETHVMGSRNSEDGDDNSARVFPWGGDVPDEVAKYVSPYALWTRLKEEEDEEQSVGESKVSVIELIENNLWDAFCEHLELYLDLIRANQPSSAPEPQDDDNDAKMSNEQRLSILFGNNDQANYIEYRRTKDPAKPMLNSLYGPDFANRILDQVLFPPPET